ncbi:MAG: protein phosphatase 2C domain-containing protein, partial [Planctomycetes bacterium]|nr:protein phosphatase 2C domain-containing protein [Planctomycetota bacterium]
LQALHAAGAIYDGIQPGVVVIGAGGQARITDLADVLPCPLPPDAPIKATLYTAPELIVAPNTADLRSDLYSFGALLYSLEYLHHPLEEKDFERQYTPLQITERNPDVHPLFLRLINKTFVRDPNTRFPTDEVIRVDPSGMSELVRALGVAGRAFDDVRLDIAAWTTTGMVRSGNEDAFTVLHGVDSRQDDLAEYVMVLLCDGMGGYEAGEIAAALAINEMRKFLLQHPIFAALTGREIPKQPVDPKMYQEVLRETLKHANKEVFTASRTPGKGKRGMGCTAECVYIDSRNVIVGHVGDSRVYHLHRGRLVQLTRDQTLVNRLVELGQLTAAEAEDHPRKNELQQAIGGQPDVVPGVYAGKMMRGDWVLVCSDGLTNHIANKELETMLTREAANSAETAARRLLNLVNLRGATDNATLVVVRAS